MPLTPAALFLCAASDIAAAPWVGSTGGGGWTLRLASPLLLAQGNPAIAMAKVLVWCAVLLAAALALGAAFFYLRRRLLSSDEEDGDGLSFGFTLADLRRMRDQGQLNEEEFEYAKRKMAARARAQLVDHDNDADPEPAPLHLGDALPPDGAAADAGDPLPPEDAEPPDGEDDADNRPGGEGFR